VRKGKKSGQSDANFVPLKRGGKAKSDGFAEHSITIGLLRQDVNFLELEPKIKTWMELHCKAGYFGLEKGDVGKHLRLQGVVTLKNKVHQKTVRFSLKKALFPFIDGEAADKATHVKVTVSDTQPGPAYFYRDARLLLQG
jgi:hypothetical protein